LAAPPTILLVEDDLATRELMATWLDAEGYLVHTASNGREALAMLETEVPSAMVGRSEYAGDGRGGTTAPPTG
jgi:CheY-like chemotaxis protein